LTDTIGSTEAMEIIGCPFFTLTRLIEEGRIEAYRLVPDGSTRWRISRKSVAEHMRRVMGGVAGGDRAYRRKIAVD